MKKYFPLKNQAELLAQSFLKQLPDSLNIIKNLLEKVLIENINVNTWQKYLDATSGIMEAAGTFGYKKISDKARNIFLLAKYLREKKELEKEDFENIKHLVFMLETEIYTTILEIKEKEHKIDEMPMQELSIDVASINNHEAVFIMEHNSNKIENLLDPIFQTKILNSVEALASAINSCIPLSIIIRYDEENPDSELEKITKHQIVKNFNIPVIFIISHFDFMTQLKIAKLGGILAISEPLNQENLRLAIHELSPMIKKAPRILIVDDDIACLTFYALELKRFGMEVDAVTDYEQTIESLANFSPDIILMDLYLSDMDGIEVAAKIRTMDKYKTVPIIFISGETETSKQFEAMRYGDDFVSKPVDTGTLVRLLQAWLELKQDSIQNTSVRLSHNKLLTKIDIDDQNIQLAKSAVSDLQVKIRKLEKEIGNLKEIPSTGELENGTVLPGINGLYEIKRILSYGGMGTVYIGEQKSDGKQVVIKVLSPQYMASVKDTMRFLQEAQILMTLDHPNLVQGYDHFQCQKLCYLVMEYIEGKEVMQILEERKRIDSLFAMKIAHGVASALSYMEKLGIVHRDIKPENIIIDTNNVPHLIDFGILKMVSNPCTLTTAGIILGTPFYISPEQIYQTKVDIRSDIYSLGAMLFHIVTGELPFDGDNPIDVMQQRLFRTPIAHEVKEDIPIAVSDLIQKMMSKEVKNRYSCVDELIKHIKDVLTEIEEK